MTAKRRRRGEGVRLLVRERGGARRFYGDFRPYGGGKEALIPRGERRATTDPEVAQKLIADRIKVLDAQRRGFQLHGLRPARGLEAFAREHLRAKADAGGTTERWIETAELHLRRAVEFFGKNRELSSIGVREVQRWVEHLRGLGGKRAGQRMSGGTARHHINTLSNLFRRAQALEVVPVGFNPVAAIMPGEKPSGRALEARWLEVHEAALLLEAARTIRLVRSDLAMPFLYPLLATFLLTGGRRAEVLGLEVSDLSFDRRTVTFRPNEWRRLKTSTSRRTVPLWPQLEEVLRAYVFNPERPPVRLLFPRFEQGREQMVTNFDKALDQVAMRAGWKAGEVRTKAFRHTYCSTRLQTLDRGAPVSVYTVGKELGHGGDSLVKRVYGHLGEVRHRSEVVEYRVEHHTERLAERLADLRGHGPVGSGEARLALSPSAPDRPSEGSTNGSTVSVGLASL